MPLFRLRCPECDTRVRPMAHYCSNGHRLRRHRCGKCDRLVDAQSQICSYCGNDCTELPGPQFPGLGMHYPSNVVAFRVRRRHLTGFPFRNRLLVPVTCEACVFREGTLIKTFSPGENRLRKEDLSLIKRDRGNSRIVMIRTEQFSLEFPAESFISDDGFQLSIAYGIAVKKDSSQNFCTQLIADSPVVTKERIQETLCNAAAEKIRTFVLGLSINNIDSPIQVISSRGELVELLSTYFTGFLPSLGLTLLRVEIKKYHSLVSDLILAIPDLRLKLQKLKEINDILGSPDLTTSQSGFLIKELAKVLCRDDNLSKEDLLTILAQVPPNPQAGQGRGETKPTRARSSVFRRWHGVLFATLILALILLLISGILTPEVRIPRDEEDVHRASLAIPNRYLTPGIPTISTEDIEKIGGQEITTAGIELRKQALGFMKNEGLKQLLLAWPDSAYIHIRTEFDSQERKDLARTIAAWLHGSVESVRDSRIDWAGKHNCTHRLSIHWIEVTPSRWQAKVLLLNDRTGRRSAAWEQRSIKLIGRQHRRE